MDFFFARIGLKFITLAGAFRYSAKNFASSSIHSLQVMTSEPIAWTPEKRQKLVNDVAEGLYFVNNFLNNGNNGLVDTQQRYTDENGYQPSFKICRNFNASSDSEDYFHPYTIL